MKKIVSIILVLVTVLSMSTMAFADGTTTLTTTVPAATYTLNIPADQTIAFGATSTEIGNVTVSNSAGFAEGKNIKVTFVYDSFKCEDTTTVIPFSIYPGLSAGVSASGDWTISSGKCITFRGTSDGTATERGGIKLSNGNYVDVVVINVLIDSANWGKALGGDYTATITFTSEVVAEE